MNKRVSSFTLKIIAILGMTASHSADIYGAHLPWQITTGLYAFGGLTFPIMAFLLTEGYRYTSNVRSYATRLFLFALIAQIPFMLFLAYQGNVLFTLFVGLVMLYLYDHIERRWFFWLIFIGVSAGSYFVLDWGFIGILMILLYHVLDGKNRATYPALLPIIAIGLPSLLTIASTGNITLLSSALYALVGCGLTIPLLLAYNGKRGRPMKYFFYVYYPAHIIILGLVRGLVFNDW